MTQTEYADGFRDLLARLEAVRRDFADLTGEPYASASIQANGTRLMAAAVRNLAGDSAAIVEHDDARDATTSYVSATLRKDPGERGQRASLCIAYCQRAPCRFCGCTPPNPEPIAPIVERVVAQIAERSANGEE